MLEPHLPKKGGAAATRANEGNHEDACLACASVEVREVRSGGRGGVEGGKGVEGRGRKGGWGCIDGHLGLLPAR